uniref:Uncharacterized protein n=1 Tax=Avena sativa TaxID=4498 RepID=A0ACD5Y9B6_AVESA
MGAILGIVLLLAVSTPATGDAPTQQRSDDDDKEEPLLSDQDFPQAIYELIVGFYEEAFERLPCDTTMPDLFDIMSTGGFCLGLLDPVSNIILNTLALARDDDFVASSPPAAAKRTKRLARAAPGSDRGGCPWRQLAIRSYYSLMDFIITYFGCITMEQAIRYLYWAGADLLLAVNLVQHDLYEDVNLDPVSERTQTALEWAADRAGHCSPKTVAQVMAIRFQGDDFALLKKLSTEDHSHHLTSEDVGAIHSLLRRQISPPCDAQVTPGEEGVLVRLRQNLANIGDNNNTTTTSVNVSADGTTITTTTTVRRAGERITSLRPIHHMLAKLSSCLTKAYTQKHTLKSPCGDAACDYLQSLKMYLHGMIHGFYIKALTLLPTPLGSLMRSILISGHCYGSMDPVSNIIINCIWYNSRGCPLPESERVKMDHYNDILDPLSLLRPVVRSLEGLAQLALFADPQSSIACAMEKLCSAQCVTVDMLPSARKRSEKIPFHEAALAAGHPLPLQLGELHQQLLLMPDLLGELRSLMSQTSSGVLSIDHISSILDKVFISSTPRLVQVDPLPQTQCPRLRAKALSVVSNERSVYQSRRSFFRSKLEQLLQKYASQHFWEPKYTLDFICGVEEKCRGGPKYHVCYRVNFMATSGLHLQKTLFFSEFWSTYEPKPNFCCPLPYPYTGRCYYGVDAARKIMYPNSTDYILCDITHPGTKKVGDLVETDIVYFSFSCERDVELAEKLNSYYAE